MPDLFEWFLIGSGLTAIFGGSVGGLAALRHMQGWLPKPYLARLERIQIDAARQIGQEVKAAVDPLVAKLEAFTGEGADDDGQVENALLARLDGIQAALVALPSQVGAAIDGSFKPILEKVEIATAITAFKRPPVPEMVRAVGADASSEARLLQGIQEAYGKDIMDSGLGVALDALGATNVKEFLITHANDMEKIINIPWVANKVAQAKAWLAQNPIAGQIAQAAPMVAKAWWELQ